MFRTITSRVLPVNGVARTVRQFATTTTLLAKKKKGGVSPYSGFLKLTYKNAAQKAALNVLPIGGRGKQIAKWWRALSKAQKAKVASAAKKMKYRKYRLAGAKVTRKGNKWNKFVKKMSAQRNIKAMPFARRVKTIAKAYNA